MSTTYEPNAGINGENETQSPHPAEGPAHNEAHAEHHHRFELVEVLRVAFVALAAAAVWFHLWEPFHQVSVIGLGAALIGGYPIIKEAPARMGIRNRFREWRRGRLPASKRTRRSRPAPEAPRRRPSLPAFRASPPACLGWRPAVAARTGSGRRRRTRAPSSPPRPGPR